MRLSVAAVALLVISARSSAQFRIEETTIAHIHAALREGRLSCHHLVARYLARIDAYDKKGPAINAIILTNPDALKTADSIDARWRRERQLVGPLHCIPMIVKDNFETTDLPTTAGSLAFQGFVSDKDATQV